MVTQVTVNFWAHVMHSSTAHIKITNLPISKDLHGDTLSNNAIKCPFYYFRHISFTQLYQLQPPPPAQSKQPPSSGYSFILTCSSLHLQHDGNEIWNEESIHNTIGDRLKTAFLEDIAFLFHLAMNIKCLIQNTQTHNQQSSATTEVPN